MKNLFNVLFIIVCIALVIVSVDSVSCHRANIRLKRQIHRMCIDADYVRISDNIDNKYELPMYGAYRK